ncbi:MAG TPA: amidohydrolase family protein [Terriglobales bacterium]|nr:amidohydrolase family protein [Terriglobales bacterium]
MKSVLLAVMIAMGCTKVAAQTAADPELWSEINKIKAVDNHTHVSKLVAPGETDDDFDALPCNILEGGPDPTMARPENPQFLEAWQKLYGYRYNDRDPTHVRELVEARENVMREQGDNFPTWVLDQLGTEYLFANRVAMGRGLNGPRFLWVPFDDALMSPLNGESVSDTPDRKAFYAREAMILKKYMTAANVTSLPPTLDEYLAKVITPTLEQQKKARAPAIKFEAAYLRSLNFGTPEESEARRIYQRFAKGGAPGKLEVLKVQDVLFRAIAREAGRLGLAVHIHTGTGCGTYFNVAGANPTQLESVLDDASLRKTVFVLIHGGSGPYTHETSFLLGKPNVYADFSEQDALIPARALSAVIREWLEWFPEKVLYGTDLAPGPPQLDWDVVGYATNLTARRGLAMALTGMVNDGEITRERALEIAHMVLRGNAVKLYGLKD